MQARARLVQERQLAELGHSDARAEQERWTKALVLEQTPALWTCELQLRLPYGSRSRNAPTTARHRSGCDWT
jgi:hypothetical protein